MSNLLILFYSYFKLIICFILLINIIIYFSLRFCKILYNSDNIAYYLFFKDCIIVIMYNLASYCRIFSSLLSHKIISYFVFITIKFADPEILIQRRNDYPYIGKTACPICSA